MTKGRTVKTLQSLFPDVDALLAMSPEDLEPVLLTLARRHSQGGMFWPGAVVEVTTGTGIATTKEFAYPHHKKHEVESLINETWECLRRDRLIMPAPDHNV